MLDLQGLIANTESAKTKLVLETISANALKFEKFPIDKRIVIDGLKNKLNEKKFALNVNFLIGADNLDLNLKLDLEEEEVVFVRVERINIDKKTLYGIVTISNTDNYVVGAKTIFGIDCIDDVLVI